MAEDREPSAAGRSAAGSGKAARSGAAMPDGTTPDSRVGDRRAPDGGLPEAMTELGVDIIRIARIRETLARFGDRFTSRVLTDAERRYVRGRAETLAGRWAAKEAVSKVLGLGVRGIGWRDIEIERLPTGQPAVRLHGRASRRAEQLGMGRIAVSISHEEEFAVAVASGVRTAGGRFLYPPDIEERLDQRERQLTSRLERLRAMTLEAAELERAVRDREGAVRDV